MKVRTILLAVLLLLVMPRPVYACDAWVCLGDILGLTDAGDQAKAIAERDAARREAEAKILAERDRELARIQAEGNERLELARTQGAVNLADTVGKYTAMQTSIEALRDVKLMQLYGDYRIAEKLVDAQPRQGQIPSDLILGVLIVIAVLATIRLVRSQRPYTPARPVYRPQRAIAKPTGVQVIDYPVRVYKEDEL